MANNQSELDRAKNESEPLFAKMLTCYASQLRNNIDDSLLPFSCICKIVHIPGNISKEKYKNIDDLEIKKCIDCAIILDEYYHKDIIAQGRQIDTGKFFEISFDVKHVSEENMHTGNYAIGKKCAADLRQLDQMRMDHWFAFRLNDGKYLQLDEFVVVNAFDVINKCTAKNIDKYFLYSIDEIRHNCKTYTINWNIINQDIPA